MAGINTVMTEEIQEKFLETYGKIYNQSMACRLIGVSLNTLESFKRVNPAFVIRMTEIKAELVTLSVNVLKEALAKDNIGVANRILKSKLNKESDLEEIVEDNSVVVDLSQLELKLADVKNPTRKEDYEEGDENL